MAFVNPCDECKHGEDCGNWVNCSRYRYWLNYCWKVARGLAKSKKRAEKSTGKWVYHHPDDSRKYIEEGVCTKCPMNGNCDEPCGSYWDWWDARMEYFRKVVAASDSLG